MDESYAIRRYEQAAALLPLRWQQQARQLAPGQMALAEELRLRAGRPMTVLLPEGEVVPGPSDLPPTVTQSDLEQLCDTVTDYSRYAAGETLSRGYLTARGGFRVGVCGTAVLRDGINTNLRDLSSVTIRIGREQPGLGDAVLPQLFRDGQFCSTVVLSPPGLGKTTLLRILCGLTRPTRGRLLLFGAADAARQSEMRRRMGCLVDGPALYADLTAWQNLKVQCLQRGLNEADIAPTLQLVGLKDTGSKPAGKFSLGMRQRLGLAVALLGKPEFLVLDEPLNGLDPMGIQELRHLLEKLNREQGMTILLSSHILSELHQLATSYGILHNGQLLEQLTAEELDARCSKYLLVRTDNDRRAVDILRKMFPEAICQATVEGLRLFPVGNEAAATASGVLMENGLHVQELAVRSEGLEAYFTALVGGDSHADAG